MVRIAERGVASCSCIAFVQAFLRTAKPARNFMAEFPAMNPNWILIQLDGKKHACRALGGREWQTLCDVALLQNKYSVTRRFHN